MRPIILKLTHIALGCPGPCLVCGSDLLSLIGQSLGVPRLPAVPPALGSAESPGLRLYDLCCSVTTSHAEPPMALKTSCREVHSGTVRRAGCQTGRGRACREGPFVLSQVPGWARVLGRPRSRAPPAGPGAQPRGRAYLPSLHRIREGRASPGTLPAGRSPAGPPCPAKATSLGASRGLDTAFQLRGVLGVRVQPAQ